MRWTIPWSSRRWSREDEDTLTLARGFIGAYPNAFYLVTMEQLPDLVDTVCNLASEDDYAALAARYAIRRIDDRQRRVARGVSRLCTHRSGAIRL